MRAFSTALTTAKQLVKWKHC